MQMNAEFMQTRDLSDEYTYEYTVRDCVHILMAEF